MFSGGVKRDQWHEMSLNKRANLRTRGTKKTKHAKYARICAYHEVNVHFSENSACFVFLLSPSWDSSFCLKTDKLNVPKQRYFCHRCVCVCVRFTSFIIYTSSRGDRTRASISKFKTDQTDFTHWISFLPSKLAVEISPNLDVLSANT